MDLLLALSRNLRSQFKVPGDDSATYWLRKNAHRCVKCAVPLFDYYKGVACEECLKIRNSEKNKAQTRKQRRRKYKTDPAFRANRLKLAKDARQFNKENGICLTCGGEANQVSLFCDGCHEKSKKSTRQTAANRRLKYQIENSCTACGTDINVINPYWLDALIYNQISTQLDILWMLMSPKRCVPCKNKNAAYSKAYRARTSNAVKRAA